MINVLCIFMAFIVCVFTYNSSSAQDKQYESLMYGEKEINWLKEAIKAYEQDIPLEILLTELYPPKKVEPEPQPEPEVEPEQVIEEVTEIVLPEEVETKNSVLSTSSPAFYLNSILYFSPNSWSIWLNDNKVTSYSNYVGDLQIIDVTQNSVTFLWENSNIDSIYPQWKEQFAMLDNGRLASNNKNIVVDTQTGNISFILSPNQSLVSKNMSVVEGKHVEESLVDKAQDFFSNILGGDDSDPKPRGGQVRGPAIAEGIIDMQNYMGQLNNLTSALDTPQKPE